MIPQKKSKRNALETDIAYSLLSLSDPVQLPKLDSSHTKMPENPSPSDKFENEFSAAQILASLAERVNLELECEGGNIEQEQPTVNYTDGYTKEKQTKQSSVQVYNDLYSMDLQKIRNNVYTHMVFH